MSSGLIVTSFAVERDKENFLKELKEICKDRDKVTLRTLSKAVMYDHGNMKSSHIYDFKSTDAYYNVVYDGKNKMIEYEDLPGVTMVIFPAPIESIDISCNSPSGSPYPVKNYKLKITKEPTSRSDILDEAKRIITSDRNNQYGEPEDSFPIIAKYWTTYIQSKYGELFPDISDIDVATMLSLFKIARNSYGDGKLDNYIDLIGYAAIAGELYEKRQSKFNVQ